MTQSDFESVNPNEYKVSSFSEYFNEQHPSVPSDYT